MCDIWWLRECSCHELNTWATWCERSCRVSKLTFDEECAWLGSNLLNSYKQQQKCDTGNAVQLIGSDALQTHRPYSGLWRQTSYEAAPQSCESAFAGELLPPAEPSCHVHQLCCRSDPLASTNREHVRALPKALASSSSVGVAGGKIDLRTLLGDHPQPGGEVFSHGTYCREERSGFVFIENTCAGAVVLRLQARHHQPPSSAYRSRCLNHAFGRLRTSPGDGPVMGACIRARAGGGECHYGQRRGVLRQPPATARLPAWLEVCRHPHRWPCWPMHHQRFLLRHVLAAPTKGTHDRLRSRVHTDASTSIDECMALHNF